MARPKGRPKGKKPVGTTQTGRLTIINLKGSQAQADWLEAVHRKTRLAKSEIVRISIEMWAKTNGHPPFPPMKSDE